MSQKNLCLDSGKRIKEFHGQELSHACSRVIFVYICKVISKFCEIVTFSDDTNICDAKQWMI